MGPGFFAATSIPLRAGRDFTAADLTASPNVVIVNESFVRKFGLAAGPHPFLAAAVTATSSFIVSLLTLWYVEKSQETWKMNRQCFWWFLAAGITISFGMVCIYYALDLGKVSVVIPIASTGPFFSLILTALFLRDVERVTFRIVLSAAMIVSGVVLLTLWK